MTTPPATPAAVPMSDPAKVLHRAPVARTIRPALAAVLIAWAIVVVFHLVYLVREFLWMIDDGPDLPTSFGNFGEGAILQPLVFFIGAGALLVLLLPIIPETPLLTVMMRAALAGVGGFVLLTLLGLIEAIADVVQYRFAFGYFVNDWFGYPLVVAFDLTALLVIGAVIAWAFTSKKAPATT